MQLSRRLFLGGLIAAPAIVAVTNIMPVRSVERFLAVGPHKLFVNPWAETIGPNTYRSIQEAVRVANALRGDAEIGLAPGFYCNDLVNMGPHVVFVVDETEGVHLEGMIFNADGERGEKPLLEFRGASRGSVINSAFWTGPCSA